MPLLTEHVEAIYVVFINKALQVNQNKNNIKTRY